MNVSTSIEVEQKVYDRLKSEAEREKMSISELLEKFIDSIKPKEKTLDEQIWDAIQKKNIPHVKLEVNEQGHIIIDEKIKREHPDIYDWAVNG